MPHPTLSADALRDLQALYEKRGERPDTTKAYADWLRALDESAPALLTAASEYLVMTAERDFWRSETARETEQSQGLAGEVEKLRAALERAREFIKDSAFDVPTKDYFDAVMAEIDGAALSASTLPRPASGPAEAGAEFRDPDPNCPDCLGEGGVIYSFEPPGSHACQCTYPAPPAAGSTEGCSCDVAAGEICQACAAGGR